MPCEYLSLDTMEKWIVCKYCRNRFGPLMITSGPVYSVIYSSLLSLSSWFHPVPFGAEQRCSSVAFVEAGSAELHLPLSVQG